MEVTIIFKIAAVGILVSVLCQVPQAQRAGRTGISGKPCGTSDGSVLDCALYL